jgi:hypothetical protein
MKICVAIFASGRPLLPIKQAGVCLLPQPTGFPAMPQCVMHVYVGPGPSQGLVIHITLIEGITSLFTG